MSNSYWALQSLCSLITLTWHLQILYLKIIITHKLLKYFWSKRNLQGINENNGLSNFYIQKKLSFPYPLCRFLVVGQIYSSNVDSEDCSICQSQSNYSCSWPNCNTSFTKVKAVLKGIILWSPLPHIHPPSAKKSIEGFLPGLFNSLCGRWQKQFQWAVGARLLTQC